MTAHKAAGFTAGERGAMQEHTKFDATLFRPDQTEKIGSGVLLTLPNDVSATLPSRGMILVKGTINGAPFQAALEPDGKGSHWFKVGDAIRSWVRQARSLLAKADRVEIGDELIGQVLSGSPPGTDGIWPAESVRDLLEEVGSQSLARGLALG